MTSRAQSEPSSRLTSVKCGMATDIKLSLDEFLMFDPSLMVDRYFSRESTSKRISIVDACKSLRGRHRSHEDAACFTLCFSADAELNARIDIPKQVRERSLFSLYWPSETQSNYFKYRNKLFHTYQEKYKSHPNMTYAGTTDWIHVISGTLLLTIIKPTKLNLLRYTSWSEPEQFVPEEKTCFQYELKDGNFITIPPGWISMREAVKTTFAMGGEFLNADDLSTQLEAFEKDIARAHGYGDCERDTEIRHLYWFFAAHILSDPLKVKLSTYDLSTLDNFRGTMSNWRIRSRKAESEREQYISPRHYAPAGIQIDIICKDLNRFFNLKFHGRRSLKGSKDPVDIASAHPSIDSQSN